MYARPHSVYAFPYQSILPSKWVPKKRGSLQTRANNECSTKECFGNKLPNSLKEERHVGVGLVSFNIPRDQHPFQPRNGSTKTSICVPCSYALRPNKVTGVPLKFKVRVPSKCTNCVFPHADVTMGNLIYRLPPISSNCHKRVRTVVDGMDDAPRRLSGKTQVKRLIVAPIIVTSFIASLNTRQKAKNFKDAKAWGVLFQR